MHFLISLTFERKVSEKTKMCCTSQKMHSKCNTSVTGKENTSGCSCTCVTILNEPIFEFFAFLSPKIAQNPLTMRCSCDTLVTQEYHL